MATQRRSEQDQQEIERADARMQAQLQARVSAPETGADPRVVTTGGKTEDEPQQAPKVSHGVDLETGERVEVHAATRGVIVTRHLAVEESAPATVAQLDAVAFTVVPPEGSKTFWLIDQMERFLPIDGVEQRRGCFGFKHSLLFGEGAGLMAWGGKSQRGRVYFSIQGKGCSLVGDWQALQAWLVEHSAVLKRVDVAYDDFSSERISIAWAVEQYHGGGFSCCGRQPSHIVHGEWLLGEANTDGLTFGIGKRKNGKHCRVYEKGKQLGDPSSRWVRVEVEWRSKDRLIPLDILTRPGSYLAGAYPCLAGLDLEQSRIKTVAHAASIEFEVVIENAKRQSGLTIDLLLHVFGGDVGEVVARLRRKGMPERLKAYSHQLAGRPELLDPSLPDGFASIANRNR